MQIARTSDLKYQSPNTKESRNAVKLPQQGFEVFIWNLAEGTIEPLLNNVEGASQRYVILDHVRYSINEISKQFDAIAVDQNDVGYMAGFPDHPDHRQDPKNSFHVKKQLLGLLDASNNQVGRRYISLIGDSYSIVFLDLMFRLANGGCASIEKQHAELKMMAAVVITRRLQRLAEGGGLPIIGLIRITRNHKSLCYPFVLS